MRRILTIGCLLLAACASPSPSGPGDDTSSSTATTADTTTTTAALTMPPVDKQPIPATTEPASGGEAPVVAVAAAVTDLASRLGTATTAIETVSSENVTWPNGAIGCPRPGSSYTQALVPGYQIVLRHDGRTYRYHGAEGDLPFLCERPALDHPDDDTE